MAPIFKVSYVVAGGGHPGAIVNEDKKPKVGDRVKLGKDDFEVVEVLDLIPARGDFNFLHVTVRPLKG